MFIPRPYGELMPESSVKHLLTQLGSFEEASSFSKHNVNVLK